MSTWWCVGAGCWPSRLRRAGGAAAVCQGLFIVIGYLAQLVPWFFIGRITFAYHYFLGAVSHSGPVLCLTACRTGGAHRLKPAMYAITAGPRPTALFYPCWWASRSSRYGTRPLRGLPPF
ncbi:MAG: hypothetical protein ACLSHC_10910 [Bilophila wadsworthia]